MKKIVKLSVIREEDENPCPFGLTIPDACMIAGSVIFKMTPIEVEGSNRLSEEDKQTIIEANKRVLMMSEEKKATCRFANHIFNTRTESDEAKVECSFGDTAAGVGSANFNSTPPLYQYLGVSFNTLPISFYNMDYVMSPGYEENINRYFASEKDDKIKK